jgi:MurNAc alpha-1-phosphate uridylyltransferase
VKAMILAAGLGQRMRPLTDQLPKPLLQVGGKPLLQYHLENLRAAGITEIIINLAYLGEKIREFVGDGSRFGVQARYSQEPEPLETAGALLKALPLLGGEPFLVINSDVWSDYSLNKLADYTLGAQHSGHLILVPNPDFHPVGDFGLRDDGVVVEDDHSPRYTFAGISLLHPHMIATYPQRREKFPLVEVFRYEIARGNLTAEVHRGRWSDVGTPERLRLLGAELMQRN